MNDDTLDLTQNQIIPLLSQLDEDTRDLALDMLNMSICPIEHHPRSADIVGTLLLCAKVDSDVYTDNPIIVAANAVREIYALAHGQHLDVISDLLMTEYLDIVA